MALRLLNWVLGWFGLMAIRRLPVAVCETPAPPLVVKAQWDRTPAVLPAVQKHGAQETTGAIRRQAVTAFGATKL